MSKEPFRRYQITVKTSEDCPYCKPGKHVWFQTNSKFEAEKMLKLYREMATYKGFYGWEIRERNDRKVNKDEYGIKEKRFF